MELNCIYDHKKRRSGLSLNAEISDLTEGQNLILPSTSAMLASNDALRKSMTFLMTGVKLVVKTFPLSRSAAWSS